MAIHQEVLSTRTSSRPPVDSTNYAFSHVKWNLVSGAWARFHADLVSEKLLIWIIIFHLKIVKHIFLTAFFSTTKFQLIRWSLSGGKQTPITHFLVRPSCRGFQVTSDNVEETAETLEFLKTSFAVLFYFYCYICDY